MPDSDEHLMERMRARDAAAFEVLYGRYRDRVRHHLVGMVREGAAAEDLVQEVFLRLWTRAEQWEGRGSCRSWLFRIATNLALNHLRDLQRRREQPLAGAAETGGDEESLIPDWMFEAASLGPEAALEQTERAALLRRLVASLPEEKREVLRMIQEEEMEVRDVADALGIPEGTVKSRLHYARQRLVRAWEALEAEDRF